MLKRTLIRFGKNYNLFMREWRTLGHNGISIPKDAENYSILFCDDPHEVDWIQWCSAVCEKDCINRSWKDCRNYDKIDYKNYINNKRKLKLKRVCGNTDTK